MTVFAALTPPYLGHLNPFLALAETLRARGDRVVFVLQEDGAQRVRERGHEAVAVGAASHPPGMLAQMERRLAGTGGPWTVPATVRDMVDLTNMLCREVPAAVQVLGAEVILADQLEPAGGLVARRLGLAFGSVANALPINEEPDVPPPYIGWGYKPDEKGRRRNGWGRYLSGWLMRPLEVEIARWSAQWGLGPLRTLEDCLSPAVQVAQCVEPLDFPRARLPPGFTYAGPFRGGYEVWEDPEPGDRRPLVYASLGTLQGSRARLLGAIAQACAALDVRLVLAHGGGLSPEEALSLPGRPIVMAYAPQRAILARAQAIVCHAGFNTVLDALACGVSMVLAPLGFEQPGTAARVARTGAGLVLGRNRRAGAIAQALSRVLVEPSFRANAARLAAAIATSGGVECAADKIQSLTPRKR